ncbi:uncharacterized protein N7515_009594 [Penicillium bovifimosum]|uniref:Zn(2)-C6 fungal-type domain-containing protein n=1 Tax=Penicillium bovifimosum TaxID=126998 RepID=A0A9W9GJL2_9EURO|nr:uncharacterized protein N7515_009594 [Penicillium bovifimosum]KAJ5121633.1 hypothetical protein N7515_009594 [Penicillium bovifimosum]
MPPDAKTKIRPQQSCHRCRERKVKCDRSIPCHACIIRGLEAECTYLTTAEDRAHISQSEIIDRLRREVAQLREHLSQSPREQGYSKRPSPSPDQGSGKSRSWNQQGSGSGSSSGSSSAHTGYVHANADSYGHGNISGYVTGAGAGPASSRGTPDAGDESWRGSSPASTMTNSVVVTSPDSTGSDSGVRSASVSSRSVSASVSVSASAYPVGSGYVPQIAELDESTTVDPLACGDYLEDTAMAGCYAAGMGFAPGDMSGTVPAPMQGLPTHGLHPQNAMWSLDHPPLYGTDNSQYLLDGRKMLPYYYAQDPHYATPLPKSTIAHYGEEYPASRIEDESHNPYHQPGVDAYGNPNPNLNPNPNQFSQLHPYQTPTHYSDINSFNSMDVTALSNPNFSLSTPTLVAGDSSSHASPISQDRPSPTTVMNSMPNSWKGEGKQELLEILLKTISSCDEEQLPQVIQVLRMSPSPEEAVSGVCRVLGLGNRGITMG